MRGRCSECRQPAPGYDRLPERSWLFVPLWGIKTYFRYAPLLQRLGVVGRGRQVRQGRVGRVVYLLPADQFTILLAVAFLASKPPVFSKIVDVDRDNTE